MKLKLQGVTQKLKSKGDIYTETYHDFIRNAICENPSPSCYFSTCEICPKTATVLEKLKNLFEENEVTEIQFSQWTSTDRYLNFST